MSKCKRGPMTMKEASEYGLYETKDRRVQLLMQQSIYNDIKRIADIKNVSVNELINQICRQYRTAVFKRAGEVNPFT